MLWYDTPDEASYRTVPPSLVDETTGWHQPRPGLLSDLCDDHRGEDSERYKMFKKRFEHLNFRILKQKTSVMIRQERTQDNASRHLFSTSSGGEATPPFPTGVLSS